MMTAPRLGAWAVAASLFALLPAPSAGREAAPPPYPYAIDEDRLGGAPDQSALNRPLSGADRIVARQGHFYAVGADGIPGTDDDRRVRLFGINLSFGANFPPPDQAPALARRLRKLGFNAVRLHHLDSLPSDPDGTPIGILTAGPHPSFHAGAVARLRALIDALTREGLYVNLNLHVGYRFRPAVDGLPRLDAGRDATSIASPLHVYAPALVDRQETYARQLIRRLGLKNHPGLAMVEINNEASLLWSWTRRGAWAEARQRHYAPELERRWQVWLAARHGSVEAACRAWIHCPGVAWAGALPAPEDEDGPDGPLDLAARRMDRMLQRLGVDRAREHVEAPRKKRDFVQFLADTDAAYFVRLRRAVHEETDPRVPVTGTQMAFGGIMNLFSQRDMDYVDEHVYVAHPIAGGAQDRTDDWRMTAASASGSSELSRLLALSLRRDAGKPFVVSEYNQPYPNPGGSAILPIMATLASLQDWDGLFFFDYADQWPPPEGPTRFSLAADWGKLALAGQSALLFRSEYVRPLARSLDLPLPESAALDIAQSAVADALERSVERRLSVVPAHAWSFRLAQAPGANDASWTPPPSAGQATPDGQARHDAAQGLVIVDTPRAWGVFGPLAGRLSAADHAIRPTGPAAPVSLLLTPLDGHSLAESGHMLLTVGSATAGRQPGSQPPRPKRVIPYPGKPGWITLEPDAGAAGPSAPRATAGPTWLARHPLEFEIATQGRPVAVHPLDGAGRRMAPLPTEASGDQSVRVRLYATPEQSSPWFEIVRGVAGQEIRP